MDVPDDDQKIEPEWVRTGWSSRSSSWHGYEVETSWCQPEFKPIKGPDILLNGVLDPQHFNELGGVLHRLGLSYSLELYRGDHTLIHEMHV